MSWLRLINLFSPHHLSPTQGSVPADPANYTGALMCVCECLPQTVCVYASSVILSVQLCVCACVFESRTPERHKRLMYCHESTDGVVRDCVPQSCDQALCVHLCVRAMTAVLPECRTRSPWVNVAFCNYFGHKCLCPCQSVSMRCAGWR